jgi:hypothetical protein
MPLKLTAPLRREIEIDGEAFTVVVSAEGIRLSRKRFRTGRALTWRALWSVGGDELERSGVEESTP